MSHAPKMNEEITLTCGHKRVLSMLNPPRQAAECPVCKGDRKKIVSRKVLG